jgi:hypothetical protein
MKADALPSPGVGKVAPNFKTPLGKGQKLGKLSRKPRPK